MLALFFAAVEEKVRMGPLILIGGLVGLFACSRILSGVLAPSRVKASPGMRAIGLFLPIAVCSITAMVLGHPEIAVGIVFGTSVGALTTVVGFTALAEPIGAGPARWRRLWPFPLAAALIVFVAGFKGQFAWRDAVTLAVEGVVVLMLWREKPIHVAAGSTGAEGARQAGGETPVIDYQTPGTKKVAEPFFKPLVESSPEAKGEEADEPEADEARVLKWLEFAVALPVMVLAGWAVTEGLIKSSVTLKSFSLSGLAATVVSLALVMPMTYGVWRRSTGGRGWEPMTTQVGVVLLNLCVLLPILIALPYVASIQGPVGNFVNAYAGDAMTYGAGLPKPLLFPVAFWRIDTVLLIIVTVLFLPVSAGKWNLGREEGMTLVAGYFFYLTAILWAAGRM